MNGSWGKTRPGRRHTEEKGREKDMKIAVAGKGYVGCLFMFSRPLPPQEFEAFLQKDADGEWTL